MSNKDRVRCTGIRGKVLSTPGVRSSIPILNAPARCTAGRRPAPVRVFKLFEQQVAETYIWGPEWNVVHQLVDVVIHGNLPGFAIAWEWKVRVIVCFS